MDFKEGASKFDPDQALRYAEEIAFPRKTGTPGEQRAAQTITRIVTELGYQVEEEAFSISHCHWLCSKGLPLLSPVCLVLARLTFKETPSVGFLLATISLVGIGLWEQVWVRLGKWIVSEHTGRGTRSKNILAHFPGTEDGRPLYLVAHYDSKSQSWSLYLRAILFLLGSAAGGIFGVWVWIDILRRWMGGGGFQIPLWVEGCVFLAIGLGLLLLFSRGANDSEGAVDNASGVGVLLETARGLYPSQPRGIRPLFLFTGAEEMGLLGSILFQKKHGEEMARDGACVINVDSLGEKGKMKISPSGKAGRRWVKQVSLIAQEKGIRLRPLPFLKGIMMDHMPFGRNGVPSISLTSIWKEGWHIHTSRDRFSMIQRDGLKEMGELIQELMGSLGKEGGQRRSIEN